MGGCDVKNLPPEKLSHYKDHLTWGGVECERLPAADVGGGGEEGEDEDDGVEEVPAS